MSSLPCQGFLELEAAQFVIPVSIPVIERLCKGITPDKNNNNNKIRYFSTKYQFAHKLVPLKSKCFHGICRMLL